MLGDLNPVNNNDDDFSTNYYLLFTLLVGLATTLYLITKAASQNRLSFKDPTARFIAGVLTLMVNTLHTKRGDLEITNPEGQIIAIGPHRTGLLDAAVASSKITGTPPRFFATDAFNTIPGVAAFMKMFETIPVAAKTTKNNTQSANAGVIDLGCEALSNKGCVALFPQGNFAKLGQDPHPVYAGAAKMALKSKAPIQVIRLDGFGFEKSLLPAFILNNSVYRAMFSLFSIRNITATRCCVIDFHLQPENENLTDEEKIEEICAQIYAYFRKSKDLTSKQIDEIGTDISSKKHHLIWGNKKAQEENKKEWVGLKKDEAAFDEPLSLSH
ncbi:MAG: 1-acyl-sn-glycerol-3-phosphate acyltransferase [Legionella sp.]|uniref:lysophospholipid acyltransferase family protein n=1 Tax=Legionella sp. TaxID=459 RepID=UPI00283C8118|nr:1-acyl-sn-glycerol-3-phosphate acyltransferase [Legionella sp.]